MKVEIEEVQGKSKAAWIVRLDGYTITFRSQTEAQAFAEQLQTRQDAPHDLPASCNDV
ncbi:hypothetical protein [Azotobacter beijerinckii]|uniref:hypothetical protein n=1 Tax=Azotobacter beijerinckii TaxID=170623 RepID=UPI00147AB2F4|nr:hypothetical protein [Azotobacter beijerinckii]